MMFFFFFSPDSSTYIYTQAHSFQKVYKNVFWLFLHCSRHAPKHLGIYCLWNLDKHYKIKSALHIFKVMETDLVTKHIVQKSLLVNKNLHFFYSFSLSTWKRIAKKSQKSGEHIFGPYAVTVCISSTRPDQ